MTKIDKKKKKNIVFSHATNLSNMKLLISDPLFQKEIKIIRKHLNIDPDKVSNDKEFRKWYKKFTEKNFRIYESKEFFEKEKKIKKQLKGLKIRHSTFNKRINLLYEELPLSYLSQRIEFLIEKFNIPLNYKDYLEKYITRGIISAPYRNYVIAPHSLFKKPYGKPHTSINIYSQLTNQEIKDLKKDLEWANRKLPKYKPLKNIDQNLEIEDYYKNKEKKDTFTQTTYKMDNKEIALNLLGDPDRNKDIYDKVRILEKTRKKRFHVIRR